ncbi:hypothetical protein LXL04_034183 [Taraxacum kok-saghyz]
MHDSSPNVSGLEVIHVEKRFIVHVSDFEDRRNMLVIKYRRKCIPMLLTAAIDGKENIEEAKVINIKNIDQKCRLCIGTRLRVIELGNRVIEAEIISVVWSRTDLRMEKDCYHVQIGTFQDCRHERFHVGVFKTGYPEFRISGNFG